MKFPAEMTPRGPRLDVPTAHTLEATEGLGLHSLGSMPTDLRLTVTITPLQPTIAYGVTVRASGDYSRGYEARVSPSQKTVEVRRPLAGPFPAPAPNALFAVDGLDGPVTLEIVCQGDVLDLCLNDNRVLGARIPQDGPDELMLFCQDGAVRFDELTIEAL